MTDNKPTPRLDLPPMTRFQRWFSFTLFFLFGVIGTAFVLINPLDFPFLAGGVTPPAAPSIEERAEKTVLYQCPMHPEVIEDAPGNCPICSMPLQPMEDHEHPQDEPLTSEPRVIFIDPVQVQNVGVVSEVARSEEIARSSRTVGILDFNANRVSWVNTKFEGWIEKVSVNYVGQEVKRGEPLFEIYSPELVTTQEEYLRALDYRASLEGSSRVETKLQAARLVRATRARLLYWGIDRPLINQLERSGQIRRRIAVRSPADGVVAEMKEEALEGMFVRPGMDLYKIADLSSLWVHADIYESDMPWIRPGQDTVVSFRHDPERNFHGQVLFLYPEVSRETRTLKICVEVPNTDGRLRPGMYADVIVHGPAVVEAVVIPRSAVLRSGERDLVFVDLGDGRFEPREVRLGVQGRDDRVQIVEGVAAGESVVTQAQFMLDSESRVQEAIAKFVQRTNAPEVGP